MNIKKNSILNIAYACKNKNDEIREKSSSGGIFFEIAREIINQGGFVYGASFDNNFFVKHKEINSIKEIQDLMGSKYIQSDLNTIFLNIKEKLEKKNKVLFVGTPCQIHA